MNGPYAFALAAGMAATVNPCGFALLPAYLSAFVGIEHRGGRAGAVGRALTVSLALTAGFVLVFGTFGLIVSPLALRIEKYLPWATVVIGFGLLGLGVALLLGRQLMIKIPKFQKGSPRCRARSDPSSPSPPAPSAARAGSPGSVCSSPTASGWA